MFICSRFLLSLNSLKSMVQSFQDMDLVRDLFGTKGLLIYFTRCLRAESNWRSGSNKPETISYRQPSTPKVFSLLRVLEITGMKLLIWPFSVLLHSTRFNTKVHCTRDAWYIRMFWDDSAQNEHFWGSFSCFKVQYQCPMSNVRG